VLVGVAIILKTAGALKISEKNIRSSSRAGAFIATHIIINRSLRGRGGL